MKTLIITILVFISLSSKAQLYDQQSGTGFKGTEIYDTIPANFIVTSLRYEFSILRGMRGYVVRELYTYWGDKMPCNDCDYEDFKMVKEYLNLKKKSFDKQFKVWTESH